MNILGRKFKSGMVVNGCQLIELATLKKDDGRWLIRCRCGELFYDIVYRLQNRKHVYCKACVENYVRPKQIKKPKRSKFDLKKIEEQIIGRGGKIIGPITSRCVRIMCQCGNIWDSAPHKIARGKWCNACRYKKRMYTIDEMNELAKKHGGLLLSTEPKGVRATYTWKCARGHIFKTELRLVTRGHWCPACSNCLPHTLEECKELAQRNGGECLSIEYINKRTKIKWRCSRGHVWDAIITNIINGGWCPNCYKHKYEDECRRIIENIMNEKFPKIRHKNIINPKTNLPLELDGYNDKLKIAFEYNGKQHYFYSWPLQTKEKFDLLVEHDRIKLDACKRLGIYLIVIPYSIHFKDLFNFIKNKLDEGGFL